MRPCPMPGIHPLIVGRIARSRNHCCRWPGYWPGPLAGFLGGVGSFGSFEEVSFPAKPFIDLVEEEELFFFVGGSLVPDVVGILGGGD